MCRNCSTKPVYGFTNKRKLCKNCFIRWFEKKALYTVRKFSMLNKRDVVKYSRKNDFRSVVLYEILEMFAEKWRVRLIKKGKYDKLAEPGTTDLIAYAIVNEVINGNIKNSDRFLPVYKKIVRPLYLFLDKEVLLYAKLKGLINKSTTIPHPSRLNKVNNKSYGFYEGQVKIKKFLDNLELKHPEIKRAIVNGFLEI